MVLQTFGASRLAELMQASRLREPDTSWLLFGPDDPDVVEAVEDDAFPMLLAAE